MNRISANAQSDWIFGLVFAKEDNTICIADTFESVQDWEGNTLNYVSNVDILKEYDVSPDVKVLMYDYGNKYRLSVSDFSQIRPVPNVGSAYVDANNVIFNWDAYVLTGRENAIYGTETFVLCKLIDEEVVEIYAITPSKTAN